MQYFDTYYCLKMSQVTLVRVPELTRKKKKKKEEKKWLVSFVEHIKNECWASRRGRIEKPACADGPRCCGWEITDDRRVPVFRSFSEGGPFTPDGLQNRSSCRMRLTLPPDALMDLVSIVVLPGIKQLKDYDSEHLSTRDHKRSRQMALCFQRRQRVGETTLPQLALRIISGFIPPHIKTYTAVVRVGASVHKRWLLYTTIRRMFTYAGYELWHRKDGAEVVSIKDTNVDLAILSIVKKGKPQIIAISLKPL